MSVTNKIYAQSAERGGWPTVLAATDPDAKPDAYYGPTGLFEARGKVGECSKAGRATDAATARKLWEVSEELTGVSWP
jgi:hypothetical protein